MKEVTITEGKGKIKIFEPEDGIVSKDLPVFYNPKMKLNRDLSILLLNSIENQNMRLADPMCGTGVRVVRFLKELDEDKIREFYVNDLSSDATNKLKENLELNELSEEKLIVSNKDASIMLLEEIGFDYVDIDPFGSPNNFLDAAVKRISRNGILAVTATDTAPLSGTYPKTGTRKYWADTIRNEHKHEAGVRILIRKCQIQGAQYERALIPILSYSIDHYMRIFFRVEKGKQKVDKLLKSHKYFHYCSSCARHFESEKNIEECCSKRMDSAGPLYTGQIFDKELVSEMNNNNQDKDNEKILTLFLEESDMPDFFYDIHQICKKQKLAIPKTEKLMEKIREAGYRVSRTHFLDTAIKSDIDFETLKKLIISLCA
ncbi:tRNA (guanine(10)-N(2))-dimethyltransferase [archaeon D22]|nr:tRNA (guanine(10)-N(2))-dimethyltransferase [archaeon D22]